MPQESKWYRDNRTDAMSVGVITLAGIVVSIAILLVNYTNTLRRGDNTWLCEAVERTGRMRLRPILTTSLATIGRHAVRGRLEGAALGSQA